MRLPEGPLGQLWAGGVMTSPPSSTRWLPPPTSWAPRSMRCRRWGGQKDLRAANWVARASPKNIHFFWITLPTESPKIMGFKCIHSSKALQQQGGLTFCPWCSKGVRMKEWWWIICKQYTITLALSVPTAWTTSPPVQRPCVTMPICKATTASDDDDSREEDYKDDDNGNKEDEFKFKGD